MLDVVPDELESEVLVRPKAGGSRVGREILYHDREAFHAWLYQDYFLETPTFEPIKFQQRHRMRKELFVHIMDFIAKFDPWFVQKPDALGRMGLSTLQKCIVAIRMVAYKLPADACDDYCRLGESTASECMKRFVVAIHACFESTYLR